MSAPKSPKGPEDEEREQDSEPNIAKPPKKPLPLGVKKFAENNSSKRKRPVESDPDHRPKANCTPTNRTEGASSSILKLNYRAAADNVATQSGPSGEAQIRTDHGQTQSMPSLQSLHSLRSPTIENSINRNESPGLGKSSVSAAAKAGAIKGPATNETAEEEEAFPVLPWPAPSPKRHCISNHVMMCTQCGCRKIEVSVDEYDELKQAVQTAKKERDSAEQRLRDYVNKNEADVNEYRRRGQQLKDISDFLLKTQQVEVDADIRRSRVTSESAIARR